MTLPPNTITWGVPGTASINHTDMICFSLFRGCLPFNPMSKIERVKKMEEPTLLSSVFFFFLSSFFNAKSDSVWGIAAGYKTVLPPSKWPNKCETVLIPFQSSATYSIFTAMCIMLGHKAMFSSA